MSQYTKETVEAYQRTDLKPDKRYSILPTVIDAVGELDGKVVLDLGCGNGFFSRAFVQAGARCVIGIDDSPAQIEWARTRPATSIEYRLADVVACDFPPADIVCAPFIVNYFSETEGLMCFLKKIWQSLNRGGRAVFVIDVPSEKDLKKYGACKQLHGAKKDGTPMTLELYAEGGEMICRLEAFYITPITFEKLLQQAGFSNVERIAPRISDEGLHALGEVFWEDYLLDTQLAYYRCSA